MSESTIRKKDYRSDIVLNLQIKLGDETVDIPQHDFLLRFFTDNSARHYDCGRINGKFVNCATDDEDSTLLTCYIKNHGLGCGMLQCIFIDLSPNDGMEDGVKRTFYTSCTNVLLSDDVLDEGLALSFIIDLNAYALRSEVQLNYRPAEGGMGFKILDPDKPFEEQVTDPNFIYVIQHDYTLTRNYVMPDGSIWSMPGGCILRFDGGSLNGAPLAFNGTWVEGSVRLNIATRGTLANEEAWMWWFGDDVDLWHTFINDVSGVIKYNYSAGVYNSHVRVTKRVKDTFIVEGNGAELQVKLEDFNICCRWRLVNGKVVRRCDSGKFWFYAEPENADVTYYDIIENVPKNSESVIMGSLYGKVNGSEENTRALQIGDCIAIRDSAIASFNPERDYRSCEFAFVTDIKEETAEIDGVETTVYKVKLNHKTYGLYKHINSRYVLPSDITPVDPEEDDDKPDSVDPEVDIADVIDDYSVLSTDKVPIEANQFDVIHVSIRNLKLRTIDMRVNDDYKQENKPSASSPLPSPDTEPGVMEPAKYHKGIAIYKAIADLENVEAYNFTTGISLIRCQYSHVRDCVCVANKHPGEAETSQENEGYKSSMSYGLSISNSQNIVVDGGRYEAGSHGIVGGGNYDNRLAAINRFVEISNTQTKSFKPDWNASIDAHGDAEHYTVRNNTAGAISLSGSYHTVEGNVCRGAINIHALTYNHKILNNTSTGLEVWWMPKPKYNKVYNNWTPETTRESLEVRGNRFSSTLQVLVRSTAAYYPNVSNICLTFCDNILSSRVIFKLYPSGSNFSYSNAGEIVFENNDFMMTSARGAIIGRDVKMLGNVFRGSTVTNVAADRLVVSGNIFDRSSGLVFARSFYNRDGEQVVYANGLPARSIDFSHNIGLTMESEMFRYVPESTVAQKVASLVRITDNISDSRKYSILDFDGSAGATDTDFFIGGNVSKSSTPAFVVNKASSVSYSGNRSMYGVEVPRCTEVAAEYDLENHRKGSSSSRPAPNMLNVADLKLYYDTDLRKMLVLQQSAVDPALLSMRIDPDTRWQCVEIASLAELQQAAISTGNHLQLYLSRGQSAMFAFAKEQAETNLEEAMKDEIGQNAGYNARVDYFEKTLGLHVVSYVEGNQYDTYKYFTVPDTDEYKYIYMQVASTSNSDVTFKLRTLDCVWTDLEGRTAAVGQGQTNERPASLTAADAGFQYFDTTLGQLFVWTGTAWVAMPKYEVVNNLPALPDANTLYLIPESSS